MEWASLGLDGFFVTRSVTGKEIPTLVAIYCTKLAFSVE